MTSANKLNSSRRRDRLYGLLIICLAFIFCMLVSLWAKKQTIPKSAPEPAPRSAEGLPDFPKKVDPLALLEQASARTERPQFVGMVASNLDKNGRLNFEKKGTELEFVFQSMPNRGAQPHREGGRLPERSYCGKQVVSVTGKGMGALKDETDKLCGSSDPVALPRTPGCSLAEVTKLGANKKGLPRRGKVKVEYVSTPAGPAYKYFRGGKQRFVVSAADCKTFLKGRQARGSLP